MVLFNSINTKNRNTLIISQLLKFLSTFKKDSVEVNIDLGYKDIVFNVSHFALVQGILPNTNQPILLVTPILTYDMLTSAGCLEDIARVNDPNKLTYSYYLPIYQLAAVSGRLTSQYCFKDSNLDFLMTHYLPIEESLFVFNENTKRAKQGWEVISHIDLTRQ